MIHLLALLIVLAAAVAGTAIYAWPVRRAIKSVLCAGVVLASTGLYAILGAPLLITPLHAWQSEQAVVERRIAELEQAAHQAPHDLMLTISLAQAYMEAGAYAQSAAFYRHAVVLSEGTPPILVQYAKALIFAADGMVNADAKRALEMVLVQDKKNPEAQYFTALYQLQQGQTQEAMQAMRSLYRSLPADAPLKHVIDRQIGRK